MQISSCFNSLFYAREPGRSFVPRFPRFTCTLEKSLVPPITQCREDWRRGFHASHSRAFILPQRATLRLTLMNGRHKADEESCERLTVQENPPSFLAHRK